MLMALPSIAFEYSLRTKHHTCSFPASNADSKLLLMRSHREDRAGLRRSICGLATAQTGAISGG